MSNILSLDKNDLDFIYVPLLNPVGPAEVMEFTGEINTSRFFNRGGNHVVFAIDCIGEQGSNNPHCGPIIRNNENLFAEARGYILFANGDVFYERWNGTSSPLLQRVGRVDPMTGQMRFTLRGGYTNGPMQNQIRISIQDPNTGALIFDNTQTDQIWAWPRSNAGKACLGGIGSLFRSPNDFGCVENLQARRSSIPEISFSGLASRSIVLPNNAPPGTGPVTRPGEGSREFEDQNLVAPTGFTTGDDGPAFVNPGNIRTTNPSKVSIVFSLAVAYVNQVNAYKESIKKSNAKPILSTFKDHNATATCSFSEVTRNYTALAQDLRDIGLILDFQNLNHFGNPLMFLSILGRRSNGFTESLYKNLRQLGVSNVEIDRLIANQWQALSPDVAFRAFQALRNVTDQNEIKQIQAVLRNKNPTPENAAWLLDTRRLFSRSFQYFVIYNSAAQEFVPLVENLSLVKGTINGIPAEFQSSVKEAIGIRNAFSQLTGIYDSTPLLLADALDAIIDVEGEEINELDYPVPIEDDEFADTEFDKGTGPYGFYTIDDVIFGRAYRDMFDDMDIRERSISLRDKMACVSFARSLHDYGADQSPKGAFETLSKMANPESRSGQAILAALAEGRNIAVAAKAGITSSAKSSVTLVGDSAVAP